MNYAETGEVLAAIALYDSRRIDDATVMAWHKMLHRFTLADCLAAVEAHFAESTDYLLPAHIIRRVKSIRRRRLELAGSPVLSPADELDADGNPLPDRDEKQQQLTDLIASGQMSAAEYRDYYRANQQLDAISIGGIRAIG